MGDPERKTSADIHSDMSKALKTVKDPILRSLLADAGRRIEEAESKKTKDSVPVKLKEKLTALPPVEKQVVFAFLPHEMAKVSIFFPMSDKELRSDSRLIGKIVQENSWGKVTIEGVKLAIFEEDIFLAIMKLAKSKNRLCTDAGKYYIKTSIKEVANLLYASTGYSTSKVADMLLRALKNFQLVRFEIDLKGAGGKRGGITGSIGNIVESFYHEKETNELSIYFNPHFCMFFLESMLTNINFSLRRKLKKDGSKALLRFLSAHSNPGRMHILTVLKAINYNTDQPMSMLRHRFKSFVSELKKYAVLSGKTKIHEDDTVSFGINSLCEKDV